MATAYCANLSDLYQPAGHPKFEFLRGPSSRAPPVRPIVPDVAETSSATAVRIDLHLHSSASFDCNVPPLDVARRCRELGLSPIFLTDHDVIDGARSLLDTGQP